MLRIPVAVGLLLGLVAAGCQPSAGTTALREGLTYPSLSGPTTTSVGGFARDQWDVDWSSDPLDHSRIVRVHASGTLRGVIVMPNPLSFSHSIYEYNESNVYSDSTAGHLASNGYDVWLYSGRGWDIPDGACTVPFSCAIAATWNLDSVVSDVQYVRSLVMSTAPPPGGKNPAIGGLSLGGMATIATINAHPSDWSGAFIWEGGLYSNEPAVQTLNTLHCADANTLMTGGVYMGPTAPFILDALLAQTTPFLAMPAYVALLDGTAAPPLPQTLAYPPDLSGPRYYFFKGNLLHTAFAYANPQRATDLFAKLAVAYAVTAALRDVPCSLSGIDASHVDNLSAFAGSVLAIGGDHGFGQSYADLLGLMTSASSKTSVVQPGFGHADHFATPNHLTMLEGPLVTWLNTLF